MEIHPMEITGLWDKGYTLDDHSISSEYLGENPFTGRAEYNTIRTDIGELLFQLKYRFQYSVVDEMMKLVIPFLSSWSDIRQIDLILPAPSSKKRDVQPVFLIASEIAKILKIHYVENVLYKTTPQESKNLSIEEKNVLQGSIQMRSRAKRKINVLVVDDLYRTGTTLNECTKALKQDENIDKIFVLTMTKNKR